MNDFVYFSLDRVVAKKSCRTSIPPDFNTPAYGHPSFCCITQTALLYFNPLEYTTKEGNCRCALRLYISGKTFLCVIKKVTEKKSILE